LNQPEQQIIFNNWLQQHKALFFKVIRAYAFSSMDRDDLFQEIILQVWRSIPSFKYGAAVSTWLYRIAFNTAIKWSQKEKKHLQSDTEVEVAEYLLIENNSPVDERLIWLYEEISKLNKIDRSLTLLMLEGLNYKEMADILGISETNVGVKINRIKKNLILKSKKINYGI
jgi:RNA polymerase sigma-70 factor (ECF subfamily)